MAPGYWKSCSMTPLCRAQTNQPRADEAGLRTARQGGADPLGWLTLRRPYFYSAARQAGRFPLDDALGLVDSYSPGVARWMCRAGSLAGSYQAASLDLLTYAGLEIDARQIQRMIEQMAPRMTDWREAQAPVFNPAAGEIFCVCADGTGAPMRRKELRGRKGKHDGTAHTREVKVGALFTHRRPKPDEQPVRDYDATSYIAHIVSARTSALNCGPKPFGAASPKPRSSSFWVTGRSGFGNWHAVNFPNAIYILDYYHALEHLTLLTNALYGEGSALAKKRFRQWRQALLKRQGAADDRASQSGPANSRPTPNPGQKANRLLGTKPL